MTEVIPIPGGTATLRDTADILVAGRRAVQVTLGRLSRPAVRAILTAGAVADTDPELQATAQALADEAMKELDDEEYGRILALPDATIYALLESWTIDRPLPGNPAAVAQLPVGIYDAIYEAIQQRQVEVVDDADEFSVAAVENPESPTGASVASSASSTVARRRTSTPKKRTTSPNTSTGKRSR